jgi:hypothetical protein
LEQQAWRIAMMSRAEFQWVHCVEGVRERPWTWVEGGGGIVLWC